MLDLHLRQCKQLTSDTLPFNNEQCTRFLNLLNPQWQLETSEQTIFHTYKFKNYYQTIAFVNVVAQIAHQQDHHPDLLVSYNQCQITYSTHDVAGLSINDFICAAKINNAQTI